MSEESRALRALFDRLRCYKVLNWSSSKSDKDTDRLFTDLADADVVSSRYKDGTARHALVLDIDHPAWLVRSTTPGHYHLYIDVPEGIPHWLYMALLGTLADCGIIEPGYARASQSRGHSDVRLPWVKKVSGNQTGAA